MDALEKLTVAPLDDAGFLLREKVQAPPFAVEALVAVRDETPYGCLWRADHRSSATALTAIAAMARREGMVVVGCAKLLPVSTLGDLDAIPLPSEGHAACRTRIRGNFAAEPGVVGAWYLLLTAYWASEIRSVIGQWAEPYEPGGYL